MDHLVFINSAKGRAAMAAIKAGKWKPSKTLDIPDTFLLDKPNIYQLYEQNIGPLTPLITDALKDSEDTFPESWIREAIQIAAERNIRNWRYIQAILIQWQEKGKDEREDRQDSEKDYKRYIEGEYSDFIEH
jgi:DnaD/phage-associated family protein